jgi:hypothetical protein
MLQFNNTLPISQFVANHGIKSVDKMNLDNGKSYLLADNGISMKASAEALTALESGNHKSLCVSSCNDDSNNNEAFYMLHMTNAQGSVVKTFTF